MAKIRRLDHVDLGRLLLLALAFLAVLAIAYSYIEDRTQKSLDCHLEQATAFQQVAWRAVVKTQAQAPFSAIKNQVADLLPEKHYQLITSTDELKETVIPSCAVCQELAELLATHPKAQRLIASGDSGSVVLHNQDSYYTATLTATHDTLDGLAGYLISYQHTPALAQIEENHRYSLGMTILVLALLFGALWLLLQSRRSQQIERRRLRTIYDTMDSGLYVMDAQGAITHTNPAAAQMLGYDPDEMIGQIAHTLFHAHSFNDHMPLEKCPIFRTIQSRQTYSGQEIFRRKDGRYFTARVFSRPFVQGDQITGSVTTFEDISDEQSVQQEIRDHKERLELIIAASEIGLWDWDLSTDRVSWDDRSFEMLGHGAGAFEIDYAKWQSLIHPDDRLSSQEAVQMQLLKGNTFDAEYRYQMKDGDWLWVEARGRVVAKDADGKPLRMVGTHLNITNRKAKEQRIIEQEQLLRTIYDVLPVGITLTDKTGHIIDCNAASEALLGITKAEHLARNYAGKEWQILRPDGALMPPEEYASVRALRENRATRNEEMGIVRPEGIIWISVSAMPVNLPGFGVVIAYVDVTQRRHARDEMEKFNEKLLEQVETEVSKRIQSDIKYRTLFNAVPDAIFVHGFEPDGSPGCFSEVNDAACKLLGLDRAQALTLTPSALSAHRTPEQTREIGQNIQQRGQAEFEESLIGPDGQPRHVMTMVRVIHIDDQLTAISVVHDLTELKRLQNERENQQAVLIQQSKLAELGNMIGAIAHQWKQPLNAVSLITQGLVDAYDYEELDRDELLKESGKILKQVRFMSQTVDDFRNFYKPSRHKEPFDPKQACTQVADLLSAQLNKHDIAVTIDGPEGLTAEGYPSEFKQVILNIINNAKDALIENDTPNPAIHITLTQEGDHIQIDLMDNGGGIPAHLLPDRLFEPMISTKGDTGTGIGLSLGRTIIEEKMSGSLTAENLKSGACFHIRLPVYGTPDA